MQQVQQSAGQFDRERVRMGRIAWIVVLCAFFVCCTSVGSLSYASWRYYIDATNPEGGRLIVRTDFVDSITWTPRGSARPSAVSNEQTLDEGGELRIARLAGSPYGQAASVRLFDETVLDMWAGADIVLQTLRTSRWSGKVQQVTLEQKDGYVRYDLRSNQPFEQVTFRVLVGGAEVALQPGGSYSIEVRSPQRLIFSIGGVADTPTRVDVAVRTGEAVVSGRGRSVTLGPGQKVTIDTVGVPSDVAVARWELIRDGRFSNYNQQQYNNTTVTRESMPTLPRADTWQVTSVRQFPNDEPNGYFQLNQLCLPLSGPNNCKPQDRINIANFSRCCGQTTAFLTGVRQPLDIDISEYRSLRLSMQLRVLNQSLNRAGEGGAECPVTIKLIYKKESPADPEQWLTWCFYAKDEPGAKQIAAEIIPQQVKQFEWYSFEDELRRPDRLPNARYLQEIQIYANGHDYNVEVTDVSLAGVQDEQVAESR